MENNWDWLLLFESYQISIVDKWKKKRKGTKYNSYYSMIFIILLSCLTFLVSKPSKSNFHDTEFSVLKGSFG